MADQSRAAVAEALIRCPAPLYERMHRQGPLIWNETDRTWLVTGYELARLVLRDTRFRMPGTASNSAWAEDGSHGGFFQSMLLACEGDRHTNMRRFLSPLFAPRTVRARTERIAATMESLLDAVAPRTRVDGVTDISGRLPVSVVGDVVGVPEGERDELSELCREISRGGGVASGQPTSQAVDTALAGVDELSAWVRRWLSVPEQLVPDSLLSRGREGVRQGTLSETQIVANVFSLYIAGHDTSRNMLSGLLWKLASHPRSMADLRAGTADIPVEVDRLLLSEAPLTFTVRVASEECELQGQRIHAGDRLQVMLGAANHELLSKEDTVSHSGVSFGEGRHVCLGAHLARVEGRVLLEAVSRRWSSLRLAERPVWASHFLHRGLDSLPLEVEWCP